ncbi:NERD domain-containing protein [Sphingobacterium sp. UDSM-2020]|nr:NERD domain-containing protein [Sphingobacterium sp. UDSM-2020]
MRPVIKGYLGELTIRFILSFLNKKEYKVINNVRVFHNGIMAQIDHLIVSRFGLFVIDTKTYKGWIFGNENAYQWKQVIFNNTFRLYNPIRQNLGYTKALQANLNEYPDLDYFPIVVFTHGSKLKVNSSFPVIKYYNLLKIIKSVKDENVSQEIRVNI